MQNGLRTWKGLHYFPHLVGAPLQRATSTCRKLIRRCEVEGTVTLGKLVWEAAREHAENVRSAYWPSGKFPVDAYAIARELGMSVQDAHLPDGTSGFIIKEARGNAEVYLALADPRPRRMFTCAHEIGHFVERMEKHDDDYSFTDTRTTSYDLHEFFADEFAGSLLMPAQEIHRLRAANMSNYAMAAHFGVSTGALKKRLERLGKHPA